MSDVSLGNAKRAQKPKKAKQPTRRSPKAATVSQDDSDEYDARLAEAEARAAAAESVGPGHGAIPQDFSGQPASAPPSNPYLVTGWQKRQHVEFDVTLPSGQICRVRRLERDDLLRMDIMQYLDTFTPMLLEDSMSDEEREALMTETVKKNPEALQKMLKAIDKVVMVACVKPEITEDPNLVNYGGPHDWENPNFTPVAFLQDIDTFERMAIFGAAFGQDMDALKSVLQQAEGVGRVAAEPGV
jgi:hypothetical protein